MAVSGGVQPQQVQEQHGALLAEAGVGGRLAGRRPQERRHPVEHPGVQLGGQAAREVLLVRVVRERVHPARRGACGKGGAEKIRLYC